MVPITVQGIISFIRCVRHTTADTDMAYHKGRAVINSILSQCHSNTPSATAHAGNREDSCITVRILVRVRSTTYSMSMLVFEAKCQPLSTPSDGVSHLIASVLM